MIGTLWMLVKELDMFYVIIIFHYIGALKKINWKIDKVAD